jgi:glycosyltransferase involved in cell wall biosynthesis
MPKISIITPTVGRAALMPALWRCVRNQTIRDFEWLVHDGSPQPDAFIQGIADPRVRYMYDPAAMKIGAKRNALCSVAKGQIIAQFDDDDYYAPHYLDVMLKFMKEQGADLVKLFGFFLYHRSWGELAYLELEKRFPLNYLFHQSLPIILVPLPAGNTDPWGYGFSYVFHRRVWEKVSFSNNRDHGEDQEFVDEARKHFKCAGFQDAQFVCLHIIHPNNTSWVYPQQRLPIEFLANCFPDFVKSHLE